MRNWIQFFITLIDTGEMDIETACDTDSVLGNASKIDEDMECIII